MQIELTTAITDTDRQHLFHWREQVFPEEGKQFTWAPSRWHIVARDKKGEACAHIGFAHFYLDIGLERLDTIGVGGVVVRPEHQGQGLPTALFSYLHNCPQASVLGEVFSLFCPQRLVSYYQRHGYRCFTETVFFQQNHKAVQSSFSLMYRGDLPAGDSIHIPSHPW